MNKLILLIANSLLLTLSCLGQTTYPIARVINGDTTIIITPLQLKFANRQSATVIYLTNKQVELQSITNNLNKTISLNQNVIKELTNQITIYDNTTTDYTELLNEKDRILKLTVKDLQKKKRNSIITSGIIGILGGLLLSTQL